MFFKVKMNGKLGSASFLMNGRLMLLITNSMEYIKYNYKRKSNQGAYIQRKLYII